MSGLVVGYGKPNRKTILSMLKKIRHRGPHIEGIFENSRVIMGQNYLEADGAAIQEDIEVPIQTAWKADLRICYDGQMGNWIELAENNGIPDGVFRDERLLLHLYRQYGEEMLHYLDDAIFAFVISDGHNLFAARDLLGIKTLYYGLKDGTVFLASELKGIVEIADEVYEFPPGHYMDQEGKLIPFAALPKEPPADLYSDLDKMTVDIRSIISKSLTRRVDFRLPTGGLLSGGLDSSVINLLTSQIYREKFGQEARLQTFALGVGESEDILTARIMSDFIQSEHHEMIVDLDQILEVLPEVIYYLESFDPSLVRSSVSNYLISRYASEQGIKVLLSGEGGDEIFCGYLYLKQFPAQELFARQMECMEFLHNNASLRLDRMNHCHGVRVVAPLISGELLNYVGHVPAEFKQRPEGAEKIEKWIFRKAFESYLPQEVTWRLKQEFSQGSGSANILPAYFEGEITDDALAEAQEKYPMIRSKEELSYFRIFTDYYGEDHAVKTVGQWIDV
jgi:asparagine synthase (glutamine-hydrolysing)